jgi:hypothetical protein
MQICRLFSVDAAGRHEFKWEWRSERSGRRSSRRFDFFYDCMDDARRQGFKVILDEPRGDSAPTRYALTS